MMIYSILSNDNIHNIQKKKPYHWIVERAHITSSQQYYSHRLDYASVYPQLHMSIVVKKFHSNYLSNYLFVSPVFLRCLDECTQKHAGCEENVFAVKIARNQKVKGTQSHTENNNITFIRGTSTCCCTQHTIQSHACVNELLAFVTFYLLCMCVCCLSSTLRFS